MFLAAQDSIVKYRKKEKYNSVKKLVQLKKVPLKNTTLVTSKLSGHSATKGTTQGRYYLNFM